MPRLSVVLNLNPNNKGWFLSHLTAMRLLYHTPPFNQYQTLSCYPLLIYVVFN
jgi:hypothetical protein